VPERRYLPIQDGVRVELVPNFRGYAVGDDGSVWSRRRPGPGIPQRLGLWRRLKTRRDKDGYHHVGLYRDGRQRMFRVHVLVLLAFRGVRPELWSQGRHEDGNKDNNRLSNLSWCTPHVNAQDRVRHGTCSLLRKGTDHPRGRLTDAQVEEILLAARNGEIQRVIAQRFGISLGYVNQLVHYGGRDPRRRGERK
jgi:HNH endonuclease